MVEVDLPDLGLILPLKTRRPRQSRSTAVDENIYNVHTTISEEDAKAGWHIFYEGNDPGNSTDNHFFEQPGPKHCPPHNSRPIDYFNLFFAHSLLITFVRQTHLYAAQYFHRATESVVNWKPTTLVGMKAFLAGIVNMGLNKRPTINSYWRT